MKINLILKNLDSVRNYKVYSKANTEFEKILGNFTLKSFIKSFKNPKKVKIKTFLEEMAEKYPNEDDPYYPRTDIINNKKLKLKEFLAKINDDYIQKTYSIEKPKKQDFSSDSRKFIKIDSSPNPCTYNPKYDLIFKRIPVTTIFNTPKKSINNISFANKTVRLENIKNDKNGINSHMFKNFQKRKIIKFGSFKVFNKNSKLLSRNNDILDKEKNIKKYIKLRNENNNIKQINSNENRETKINEIIKIIDNNKINKTSKNNRNKKSSFFIKNNSNKKKRKLNLFFKTSDESSSGIKGNNIDFNKMSNRNFNIILNNSALKYPSFYSYEPKFDYVTQSTKTFNFGLKENKTNFQKKKFLLKKIWCSYSNLSKDYYLINNSKLKEK